MEDARKDIIARATAAGIPKALAEEAWDLSQHALDEAGKRAVEICGTASSDDVTIMATHLWAQKMALAAQSFAEAIEEDARDKPGFIRT